MFISMNAKLTKTIIMKSSGVTSLTCVPSKTNF